MLRVSTREGEESKGVEGLLGEEEPGLGDEALLLAGET